MLKVEVDKAYSNKIKMANELLEKLKKEIDLKNKYFLREETILKIVLKISLNIENQKLITYFTQFLGIQPKRDSIWKVK